MNDTRFEITVIGDNQVKDVLKSLIESFIKDNGHKVKEYWLYDYITCEAEFYTNVEPFKYL